VKGAARCGWYGETSAEKTLGLTGPQDAGNTGPGAQDVHHGSPWKSRVKENVALGSQSRGSVVDELQHGPLSMILSAPRVTDARTT
jgi:hypothetical protein